MLTRKKINILEFIFKLKYEFYSMKDSFHSNPSSNKHSEGLISNHLKKKCKSSIMDNISDHYWKNKKKNLSYETL